MTQTRFGISPLTRCSIISSWRKKNSIRLANLFLRSNHKVILLQILLKLDNLQKLCSVKSIHRLKGEINFNAKSISTKTERTSKKSTLKKSKDLPSKHHVETNSFYLDNYVNDFIR